MTENKKKAAETEMEENNDNEGPGGPKGGSNSRCCDS